MSPHTFDVAGSRQSHTRQGDIVEVPGEAACYLLANVATDPDRLIRTPRALPGFVHAPIDRLDRPIDMNAIANLLADIVDECQPEQIWLFGSRARGEARSGSDWDLLVVVPSDADGAMLDPRFAWRLRKRAGVRADVFLCRADDFVADRGTANTLLFDVSNDGVLIYER